MANLFNQLRATGTTAAAVTEDGIGILEDGIRGTRANTRAWARNQELHAKLDATQAKERVIAQKSEQDAEFYQALDKKRNSDEVFDGYFKSSQEAYRKALADIE